MDGEEKLSGAERRMNEPECRTVHEMDRALVEHENNFKESAERESGNTRNVLLT